MSRATFARRQRILSTAICMFEPLERRQLLAADIPLSTHRYIGSVNIPGDGTEATTAFQLQPDVTYLMRVRPQSYSDSGAPEGSGVNYDAEFRLTASAEDDFYPQQNDDVGLGVYSAGTQNPAKTTRWEPGSGAAVDTSHVYDAEFIHQENSAVAASAMLFAATNESAATGFIIDFFSPEACPLPDFDPSCQPRGKKPPMAPPAENGSGDPDQPEDDDEPEENPADPEEKEQCDEGSGAQSGGDQGGDSASNSETGGPVKYFNGQVRLTSVDLPSGDFGMPWSWSRTWSQQPGYTGYDAQPGGNLWFLDGLPCLIDCPETGVHVNTGRNNSYRFLRDGNGGFTPTFYQKASLVRDSNNNIVVFTDSMGNKFLFPDYTPSQTQVQRICGSGIVDRSGKKICFENDSNDRISKVWRLVDSTCPTPGTPPTSYLEQYEVHYNGSGADAKIAWVKQTRQLSSDGPEETDVVVRTVKYTYHTGLTNFGKNNDLKLVQILDGDESSTNVIETKYYRYSRLGSQQAGTIPSGLRFAVEGAAYARMMSNYPGSTDPDSVPDDPEESIRIQTYANYAFKYDRYGRVVEEVVQGDGCSCSSATNAGQGSYTFTYSTNTQGDPTDSNHALGWTVVTLPDQNTLKVYWNGYGQVVGKEYTETATNRMWRTYWAYDAIDDVTLQGGRVVLKALPSAVENFDPMLTDLVGWSGSNAQHIRDDSGLLQRYEYHTGSNTQDLNGLWDVTGYLKEVSIQRGDRGQQGNLGTAPIPQVSRKYQQIGSTDIFYLASRRVFTNADVSQTPTTLETKFTHTYSGASTRPQTVTIELPALASGQNESGNATIIRKGYDDEGRLEWLMDADGFVSYREFEPSTGAVVKFIDDVKYSVLTTAEQAKYPSGWSQPSDGLHLVTLMEVDGLGRTTSVTDPKGNVTYTVYNDVNHEVRVYPGFNDIGGGTYRTTGPIQVMREYWPAPNTASADERVVFSESLTTSADPDVDGGVPTGGETLTESNIQTLRRSITNDAGQVVESHEYFNIASLSAYDPQTWFLGTSSNSSVTGNYHRSLYQYDHFGRLERIESPTDTITWAVRDGLGRVTSVWVGTDDEGWDHGNPGGTAPGNSDNNMTKVEERYFDGSVVSDVYVAGTGDGNLTRIVRRPGGTAEDRITDMFYDWRNRLVASKAGVKVDSSGVPTPNNELDTEQRIITYTQYDNLNRATVRLRYDGDKGTVSMSNGVPQPPTYPNNVTTASQLRAKTQTEYDNQSRPFKTQVFSVNPTSGSIGNALTTNLWYDLRGNVIKSVAPGGLVTKVKYDGAGRVSKSYLTDGGADSTYAHATHVENDAVLSQTEYVYDANGNVELTIGKQRFDDESATDELGDVANVPLARVSYASAYYDRTNRLNTIIDLGSNGGYSYSRPSEAPGRDEVIGEVESGSADTLTDSTLGQVDGYFVGYTLRLEEAGKVWHSATVTEYDAATGTLTFDPGALDDARGDYRLVPNHLRTDYAYNAAGWTATVTDPRGIKSKAAYDNLGRTKQTIEAYTGTNVEFSGSDPDPLSDSDRRTEYVYDGSGHTIKLRAVTPDGDDQGTDLDVQETAYIYGEAVQSVSLSFSGGTATASTSPDHHGYRTGEKVTITGSTGYNGTHTITAVTSTSFEFAIGGAPGSSSGSARRDHDIFSNELLTAVQYPDTSGDTASIAEQESRVLNALGESKTFADRNGNVHAYDYDVMGRLIHDRVTTLGSGVNGNVRRLSFTFDSAGRAETFTSYSAASGGSVVNDVKRHYNGLGQLTTEWQEHSGAVTGSSFKVEYEYSEMAGGANHSRLLTVTYPDERVLHYLYENDTLGGNTIDHDISRVSSLSGDAAGIEVLESYEYLGLGTIVLAAHPESGVDLTYIGTAPGEAGDQYVGLDRFGRIVEQRWTTGSTDTDYFRYGYDRNGNRLYRENLHGDGTAFSELYHDGDGYDDLNRLTSFARGKLTSTKDGIEGTASRTQAWDLDALGNWDELTQTGGGSNQTREHNGQNQITSISGATSPLHDGNGNMTRDQNNRTLGYDAWNRLMSYSSGNPMSYAYDALGRRTREIEVIVGFEGSFSVTTDFYYNGRWQVIEEHVEDVLTFQYVWSQRYIDAMVLRDADTDSDGNVDMRHYVQSDANFNVTALVGHDGTDWVVQERYVYDPYGQRTVRDADWSALTSPLDVSGLYSFRHGHQGGRHDPNSGLMLFRHRSYSPTLGRWVQQDPLGYVDGINRYEVYGSNPGSFLDPLGLDDIRIIDGRVVWMPEGFFGRDMTKWQVDLGTVDEHGIVHFDPKYGFEDMPLEALEDLGGEDSYDELMAAIRKAQAEAQKRPGRYTGGSSPADYQDLAVCASECNKLGKEAAELACTQRIAIRAAQLAGIEAAGNSVQIGVGVAAGVGGGVALFYAITALTGPPGWIVGALGTAGLAFGGWNTYDGIRDAGTAANIMNAGRKAAEIYCKCP